MLLHAQINQSTIICDSQLHELFWILNPIVNTIHRPTAILLIKDFPGYLDSSISTFLEELSKQDPESFDLWCDPFWLNQAGIIEHG